MSDRTGGRPPKLTPAQVENAKVAHSWGIPSDSLARFWGVAGSTMRRYLRGECRQHRAA